MAFPMNKVRDDDSQILWISRELNNGDWPYYLILELQYTEYWDSEWANKGLYFVSVYAVSPVAAKDKIADAARSMSMTDETLKAFPAPEQAIALKEYGIAVPLLQKQGNNKRRLLAEAHEQLPVMEGMFGFYMDRPVNAIGDKGWDLIKGDLYAAPPPRMKERTA